MFFNTSLSHCISLRPGDTKTFQISVAVGQCRSDVSKSHIFLILSSFFSHVICVSHSSCLAPMQTARPLVLCMPFLMQYSVSPSFKTNVMQQSQKTPTLHDIKLLEITRSYKIYMLIVFKSLKHYRNTTFTLSLIAISFLCLSKDARCQVPNIISSVLFF